MEKAIEELKLHIEKIRESGILVIVEGRKDRLALEKLGIANIIELSKRPIFEIVEAVTESSAECVILTDLDSEGKKLYSRLSSDLQKFGVRIDDRLREFLFNSTKLRQIEGMVTYIENSMAKH